MVSIFEHLQSNTIVWFILAICTMLGIPSLVFAIIALKKDDKVQGFACLKKSNSIVSINQKRVKKLEVLFDNKPVDNTVITCISIWNSGNKTIRKEDIASRGPLTIVTNNGSEILDAYIIYESDPTYCFNISTVSNNSVVLDFEYVDPKKGVVLQLIHTGKCDDVEIQCTVKGGNPVKNLNDKSKVEKVTFGFGRFLGKKLRFLLIVSLMIFLIFSIISIISGIIFSIYLENGGTVTKDMFLIKILLYTTGGCAGFNMSFVICLIFFYVKLFKWKTPPEFREYV